MAPLNDPFVKVKRSELRDDSQFARSSKRIALPLYGILGIGIHLAWILLTLVILCGSSFIGSGEIFINQPMTIPSLDANVQLDVFCFLGGMTCALILLCVIASSLTYKRSQAIFRVLAFALSPWLPGLLLIRLTAMESNIMLNPDLALFVVTFLNGLAAGFMSAYWARHLGSFSSQKQSMVTLVGATAVAAIIVIIALCFKLEPMLLMLLLLPVFTILVSIATSQRVYKREQALYEEPPTIDMNKMRYFVKEVIPASASLAIAAYAIEVMSTKISTLGLLSIICGALIVSAMLMFFILVTLSQSVAFLLVGLIIPITALTLPVCVLASSIAASIALGILCVCYSFVMYIHITNISRNTVHIFKQPMRALDSALCIDIASFSIGLFLGILSASIPQLIQPCALCLLAAYALLVSFCLFTAAPASRHIPKISHQAIGFRGLMTSGMNSLRESLGTDEDFSVYISSKNESAIDTTIAPQISKLAAQRISSDSASNNPVDTGAALQEEANKIQEAAIERMAKEHNLSPRETETFKLLAKGFNANSVAEKLCVSINTTKTHIHNIYSKMDVHSHQELLEFIQSDSK